MKRFLIPFLEPGAELTREALLQLGPERDFVLCFGHFLGAGGRQVGFGKGL